jgi:hypothetical protein
MTENAQIDFTVYVDISTSPATYTYTDAQGASCDGSATVTNNNTNIIYTIGTPGLIFVDPIITGDNGGDLHWNITHQGLSLNILDSDVDNESACLILVVAPANQPSLHYPSPDPRIVNKPPTGP